MSLKVSIDKVGRTVEKDRKKNSKGGRRSRDHVDLRAVISSKERSSREEKRESRDRERSSATGDLRDRLEKNRVQIDFDDFDPIMKGENCDISELGKQKLLSMFLDGNNPSKDLNGKENEKSEDASEIVKKAKKELEKTLSSEWSQRKKKKKKRSRSRSRQDRDRKPLVDREAENRKRKHSPERDVDKIKKEKARSPSKDRDSKKKKKEKKSRKRSVSREDKKTNSSEAKNLSKQKDRSSSKDKSSQPKTEVRKSRIDSGISCGTNFSKESVSISPRDERTLSPKKEPLVVNKSSARKESTRSPRRDRPSPRRSSSDLRKDKQSPRKERISPRRDRKSPRKDKNRNEKSPKKEYKIDGRKASHSPSPSPPRRVRERSVEDDRENKLKESVDNHRKEKNPYSVYEEKHGKRYDPKRRSREREPRRRRSRERDLKDEIDEMRRERMRGRSRSREHRRHSEYERYGRRSFGRSGRFSPRGSRAPSPSSWEDKVESFLQNTSSSATLVEITPSGLLPQDFDPSKPPPNLAAVVPPDYALTEYSDPILTPTTPSQPIRLLTDVQTGQLIPQPALAPVMPETSFQVPPTYQPPPTLPPPDYEQTLDITIAKEPQGMVEQQENLPVDEFAAMNALNQETEKTRKDNRPLTLKEKKKLEKSRKEIWQFVAKKLMADPVFCNKVKKKKTKGVDDIKEKAEKCAVRLGLKLEKSGFSETRLWLMLKDNEKGILGFYDELSAAVINGTIETDIEARRPKDRLDSELLKDGTVFKYIGQYIQGNPTQGRSRSDSDLLTTGDLQSILQLVNTNTGEASAGAESEQNTPEPEPVDPLAKKECESDWDYSVRSFSPYKSYLSSQSVPSEVSDAYIHTLVLSGFTHPTLGQCVTNFQPPEPENPGEPPETVYGHLLGCLREISFEKYPKLLTENIDGHTVSIVRFVLDYFSKPKSPTPPPPSPKKSSPTPPVEDSAVPVGGNITNQLPRKKYVTVSVSVDTIPVEGRLAVWQICLHTPGLPDEQDPDFEMMMVPGGVGEGRLQEAGFMFNQEKGVWYHQGTEFGRRKAENEEKSVEKLVNYLEELRGGGRGAGLNNGLVLLFECAEDFGLVRSLLSGHSADIWSDTVRGVGCIDHYTRQADIPATYCPPYYKFCVGGEGKWLTTLNINTEGVQRQVKIEAETRAEMVYNILCDLLGSAPTYETFTKWYCYPSQSDTVATMAGNLELQRQLLPLQTHVDRQLFNSRVQCVLEVLYLVKALVVVIRICVSVNSCPSDLLQTISEKAAFIKCWKIKLVKLSHDVCSRYLVGRDRDDLSWVLTSRDLYRILGGYTCEPFPFNYQSEIITI